jgi:hypothetical protein
MKPTAMKYVALLLVVLFAGAAFAELPPPTAEQKAAQDRKKAAEAAMLKKQQQALEREQERIARQYHAQTNRQSGPAPTEVKERAGKGDVPKAAKQPLGTPAKPHDGGKSNSQAEAHSRSSR